MPSFQKISYFDCPAFYALTSVNETLAPSKDPKKEQKFSAH